MQGTISHSDHVSPLTLGVTLTELVAYRQLKATLKTSVSLTKAAHEVLASGAESFKREKAPSPKFTIKLRLGADAQVEREKLEQEPIFCRKPKPNSHIMAVFRWTPRRESGKSNYILTLPRPS